MAPVHPAENRHTAPAEQVHSANREALHRVLDDESELAQGWVDHTDAAEWRQELQLILRALK
ncbi:DUF4259 domain-containing protein [Streptomyces bullii]